MSLPKTTYQPRRYDASMGAAQHDLIIQRVRSLAVPIKDRIASG